VVENTLLFSATGEVSPAPVDAAHAIKPLGIVAAGAGQLLSLIVVFRAIRVVGGRRRDAAYDAADGADRVSGG
jgi:hypothetical protein